MPHWEASTWIASVAVLISILSLGASLWSALISYRGLLHTFESAKRDERVRFLRQRAALLDAINTRRSILDRTRVEIGTIKAIFDAEPHSVKLLLANYSSLFSDYLSTVEREVQQTTARWDEVASWTTGIGIDALIDEEARFRSIHHDAQMARDNAQYMVVEFKEKLALARKYTTHDIP